MIIGIAGYMGSGKSTLAKLLSEHFDIEIIDADKVARDLMINDDKIIANVAKEFNVVRNNEIDFKKLGTIVFQNTANLERLNTIVHPPLINKLNTLTKSYSNDVIVDAALLTYWGNAIGYDHALWISADKTTRCKRLIERTGLSSTEVFERIEGQINLFNPPVEGKWRIVHNNSSIDISLGTCSNTIKQWLKYFEK